MKILFLLFFCIIFTSNLNAYENRIVVASTTSTYDTGLLKEINTKFQEKNNIKVHVLALGTGQAIRVAMDGNVEILIVHHKPTELEFMEKGFGLIRHEFMYNDYIVIGPKNDNLGCNSIKSKFKYIYDENKIFISRGDDSGTHKKEIEIWNSIKLKTNNFNEWYMSIGQGMGKTILVSNEKNAYTIADRSTWISFNKKENLKIICENYPPLINQYGLIIVNPELNNNLKINEAEIYVNWLLSSDAKNMINNFKIKEQQLFFFNYN